MWLALLILYLAAGVVCIANDPEPFALVVDDPDDENNVLATAVQFMFTWPWWFFKKG